MRILALILITFLTLPSAAQAGSACDPAAAEIGQVIKANFSTPADADSQDITFYACMRQRAVLISHEFKTACRSTVVNKIETDVEALSRIVKDTTAACLRQMKLRARLSR